MKIRYITIEREYGSGGTKIAHRVAEETGISCYGREILEAVSKTHDLSIDDIEHYEETVSNSFMYTIYAMNQVNRGSADLLTREGHIFVAEQAEIQKMARGGKALFLGHCASKALKDEKGVLKVFIRCSDETEKRNRIVNEYGIPEKDADKTRKRFDKKRSNYFYSNTATRWDNMNNYDLIMDSAVLGIEGCVNILKSIITE